ncbi:unnamed protein product [Calypogeia fissa]
MAMVSPNRSSPTLDRYLRPASGSKGSHSQKIYAEAQRKPKKFQSANYDETTGTWRCKHCGYTYPNPEPHHHQRRAHKKICQSGHGSVHHWLTLSAGEEDSQDTSNVEDKPTTPETSDLATTQRALPQEDRDAGLQSPQLLDTKSKFHGTPSRNEVPSASEIQEAGDPGVSGHHGPVAAGENSEARKKEELESATFTEQEFKPRTRDLGRLLTFDSDVSLPREKFQGISDQVDFSGETSSDAVLVADDSAGGSKGEELEGEEQGEAHSLEAGADVLAAHDALKERTEVARGEQSTPSSSDESGLKALATEELGEGFDQREPSSNAAEDDTQEQTADVLQHDEGSQTTATEDRNVQVSSAGTGEGYGEMEAILPAAAEDEAIGEETQEYWSEQSITPIAGDGTAYTRGDEQESSQLGSGAGVGESSQHSISADRPFDMAYAAEEIGDSGGHKGTEVVDAIILESLSDDGRRVTETPPSTSGARPPVELSAAEPSWEDVVSGDDKSGKDRMQPLPLESADGVPLFSGDGLTLSQSDNREDDAGDKNAPNLESKGRAALTSDQDVGHQVGFQPAGLEWTVAFPDTVKELEGSIAVQQSSSPDQDRLQELIPGLDQETGQTNKEALRLSAAEANWDDWEDVVNRGPVFMEDLTSRNNQDPESSGESQIRGLDSLGDVSGPGQGETGTGLESESFVEGGIIDAAAGTDLPVHIPDSENFNWLIDFSEPAVKERNSGSANEEAISGIATSSPKLEVPVTKDLLNLSEGSGHEQRPSLLDSIRETGQSSEVPSNLSSALRNWEDWDDVVRESERMSRPEKTSSLSESDLDDGEQENVLESSSLADTSSILDSDSTNHAALVEPLVANDSGHEIDGLSHDGKPSDGMVTSVPHEADPLFRFPEAESEPKVTSDSVLDQVPGNLKLLDSGVGPAEGAKGVDDSEDVSRFESVQAGADNLWDDDWEVIDKTEYPPAGSRPSSPSFEDAHDGDLFSDHEYPTGLPTAVNLPLGKKRWADWEDLTKSEYMVLDGPDGESLVFKRTSEDRDKVSAKAIGGGKEISPSFEEPDVDGGSPSLRRRRRQGPSFDDDQSPSFRSLKGALPSGVVKSDYSAGSNSFQAFETIPRSLPASSPRKSESGDLAPLVTRRPLIYRGSRRDYTSEAEDQDVTSEPPLGQHLHHHNLHEHEDALRYDVEKVLRGQTTYELICPICGAMITRKIIIRKKKRRFMSAEDSRWRRGTPEITPVEDGNRSPRSDISSEIEDQSGTWKQGIRPCFGYFFGSS